MQGRFEIKVDRTPPPVESITIIRGFIEMGTAKAQMR
jgi:hypothetical protein